MDSNSTAILLVLLGRFELDQEIICQHVRDIIFRSLSSACCDKGKYLVEIVTGQKGNV